LGFPVPAGVTGLLVADTGIVQRLDSVTVRSRENGQTNAKFTVAGLTGRVMIVVDQVPTTLTVAVAFSNPVVTLPVGAPLPLACQALDNNGYQIARDPALVSSL